MCGSQGKPAHSAAPLVDSDQSEDTKGEVK